MCLGSCQQCRSQEKGARLTSVSLASFNPLSLGIGCVWSSPSSLLLTCPFSSLVANTTDCTARLLLTCGYIRVWRPIFVLGVELAFQTPDPFTLGKFLQALLSSFSSLFPCFFPPLTSNEESQDSVGRKSLDPSSSLVPKLRLRLTR